MTATPAEQHDWRYEDESDVSRPGSEFVKPGDPNFGVIMRGVKIQREVDKRALLGGDYEALKAQVTAEFDAAESGTE